MVTWLIFVHNGRARLHSRMASSPRWTASLSASLLMFFCRIPHSQRCAVLLIYEMKRLKTPGLNVSLLVSKFMSLQIIVTQLPQLLAVSIYKYKQIISEVIICAVEYLYADFNPNLCNNLHIECCRKNILHQSCFLVFFVVVVLKVFYWMWLATPNIYIKNINWQDNL